LIAAVDQVILDENKLAYVWHSKEQEDEQVHFKSKDTYNVLASNAQAFQGKNIPPKKRTNLDLITMLPWFPSPKDTILPSKKSISIPDTL
jgi:hypothetical protein